jgi:hypothetical protein
MADNIVKGDGQFFALKVLNFPSPRSFSFTIPIRKERSTDPFFRLLDFSSRNAEML